MKNPRCLILGHFYKYIEADIKKYMNNEQYKAKCVRCSKKKLITPRFEMMY